MQHSKEDLPNYLEQALEDVINAIEGAENASDSIFELIDLVEDENQKNILQELACKYLNYNDMREVRDYLTSIKENLNQQGKELKNFQDWIKDEQNQIALFTMWKESQATV